MNQLTLMTPPRTHIRSTNGFTRRRFTNRAMLILTGLGTLLALIPLFWIIGYVIIQGGQSISPAFFTQLPRPVGMEGGGVLHAIEGTVLLTLLASLFAIPPGVLTAFYTAHHPNTGLGVAIRFGTDVLAGVPSIVVGMFLYGLVVKAQGHFSALAGGLALAVLMLPTIIRTTEEMIKLVPHSLREGALALGSPEWKTSLGVILPAAGNGLVTGFLLGIARASGETAPLLFTALGNDRFEFFSQLSGKLSGGQNPLEALWGILNRPVDSLPLTLWKYSQQPYAERVQQAWAAALVLMTIVLVMNILARVWVMMRSPNKQG
jgi:phosphate transport system permease protein